MSTAKRAQGAKGTPAEVAKLDQASWEAPVLRPILTPDGETAPWHSPCPSWCEDRETGHEPVAYVAKRQHRSSPLCVRQDAAYPYEVHDGVEAAHLEVRAVRGDRAGVNLIAITAWWGSARDEEAKEFKLAQMYPDETRELIAVLQHLLKVGQED